jgi:hypothetical protein
MRTLSFCLSFGLCLWLSSAGFSQTITNVGTDFWIAFPPNSGGSTLKIFISSEVATTGQVSSAFPGVDQNFSVIPGTVTEVSLPTLVQLIPGIENKGIHITSIDPIAVYGLNRKNATTDAFMALPVTSLGTDYRIMSYIASNSVMGSGFAVAATQNGTTLTIYNKWANITYNETLNAGETYLAEGTTALNDVTGSRIQSNLPVAVYGSVRITTVPNGCFAADHIVEQMWPVTSWGKNFVTVPLAGRDASGDVFRVLAAEDATVIQVNGIVVSTLNMGEHYEAILTGYNSITASKAVDLEQYAKGYSCSGGLTGDPFMMIIPPREQFLTHYTIGTALGFATHWTNLVAPSYALGTIYEDGMLIPNGAFTQIGSTSYYGAQRSIAEGSHTYNSIHPFGVFVYGWNTADSYGYPGGGSMSPIGTVNSVTISPATASGIVNVSTICFTAHVEDDLSNPVAGVLVNFNISGISAISGTAYTDALGDANYCYARTGTTSGTDDVYAECFGFISTTSTATWTYVPPPCINPASSGTITGIQAGCGSYTAAPLIGVIPPAGYTGTMEYKWQQSITGSLTGFSDIAGSNAPDYAPGIVTQTT